MSDMSNPGTALPSPKARLSGKIVKSTLEGAIVEVGAPLPGLLLNAQMPRRTTETDEPMLKEGQTVEVWVRRIRKDRIELTMIEPLRYEWTDLQPNMVVKGKVVRLEPYGAFVEIGAERPGMVHISELATNYVKNAADVVKPGDEIEAMVLAVDAKKRQIKLSVKALLPPPAPAGTDIKSARAPKQAEKPAKTEEQREPEAPQLTSMQIAWEQARLRAELKSHPDTRKSTKAQASGQEAILERTLANRLPTGN